MLTFTQKRDRQSCSGKVTIVELLWVTLLGVGAVIGVRVGYVWFGLLGSAIGLPLGLATGLLVLCGIACVLNIFLGKPHHTKS